MFLAPPPPQVSMGAGLEAQLSGASWWGKADGQHPNLPVPSYLALTQSWALSWGYRTGFWPSRHSWSNEGNTPHCLTGVAGAQYELPEVLLKNTSQKRGHSGWAVTDE